MAVRETYTQEEQQDALKLLYIMSKVKKENKYA